MDFKFEVLITKQDDIFVAATPNFPKCKGYGYSEAEALEDLSDAVAQQVVTSVKDAVDEVLTSGMLDKIAPQVKKHIVKRIMPQKKQSEFTETKEETSLGSTHRKIIFSGKLGKDSAGIDITKLTRHVKKNTRHTDPMAVFGMPSKSSINRMFEDMLLAPPPFQFDPVNGGQEVIFGVPLSLN